jgi:hypothetical protein
VVEGAALETAIEAGRVLRELSLFFNGLRHFIFLEFKFFSRTFLVIFH